MIAPEAKGYTLTGIQSYIEKTFDKPSQERILGRVSDATRQVLDGIDKTQWYPGSCWVELVEALVQEDALPGDRVERIKALGRSIAGEAANIYLRLLLKLFTPQMFLRRLPSFFERDMRPGRVVTDLSGLKEKRVLLTVEDGSEWPYLGALCAGWIELVFQLIGTKNTVVNIVEPPADVSRSDKVLLDISWN